MSAVKFDKRLASILLKRGRMDKSKLESAAEKSEKEGRSLTTVLVEDKSLKEDEILTTLAAETNIPPIDVFKVTPDESAVQLLPENLANYYQVIPVTKIGNILTLAVSNPFDILKLDDIQIVTGCDIRPVLSTEISIKKAIPELYNKGSTMVQDLLENMSDPDLEIKENKEEVENLKSADIANNEDAPVVKLTNLTIFEAIRQKASDIHIEPQEKQTRIRFRIDGICRETIAPPKKMHNSLVSRIKIMCGLDIAERRKPQDGKFQLKIDGRQIDFRVSTLPCIHGEKVVLRVLDSGNLTLSLDQLGFEEKALKDIRAAIHQAYGMMLVTGPTGSGKSTTLYSAIREVLSAEDNIVTVEDPVEYQLEGVNQVQVSVKRGLTFAAALRSILRQDPDTILIGEIRDQETVEIAVKAALTGHLVFSTLHTNDAPSTITRMVDMGVDPFLVASSVNCVAAQRLGRKLCVECRKPISANPSKDHLLSLGFLEEDLKNLKIMEAVGCQRCANGYKGRFALLETMPLNEPLRRVIIERGSALDIRRIAMQQNMMNLRRCGLLNAMRGKTTVEEVLSVTVTD
ncbi:MAG: Flp pilus assembly complex ATPase component TadA [Planctomycetes bacterium]|nr:Flp pilus assembly complex ATPase component TadA [Planctomycetota bacterium]